MNYPEDKAVNKNPVLWLASWYPGHTHTSNGDFIERHAQAVSAYEKVIVLFIEKDLSLPSGQVKEIKTEEGNLVVYKVYYSKSSWGSFIEKIFSIYRFTSLQRKYYKKIVAEYGKPDVVHVHVAMKAGMLAHDLKRKYGIPYALTEHWTGYYRESFPNLYTGKPAFKYITRRIIEKADILLPVSHHLGKTISQNLVPVKFEVIPNVVNTRYFYYRPGNANRFRFIHPSYLNYQKNPEGMVTAAIKLAELGYDFELLLLGNDDKELLKFVESTGLLNKNILIKPELPYSDVAKQMQESSALLLFSRFENLPCVLLEALCCGLPVISSDVGGIPEVITHKNGILVKSDDVDGLVKAMKSMIDNYSKFDREAIANDASRKFSYDVVAEKYLQVYKSLIEKS